ncbi:sensor histidine kinase [Massilia pseudoviolaceinigra]|uniref:sensor histidine kinase n=1 Tax=Massilia pseudoviolaceinigra TaxID=3057165 RepID=UPI002796C2FF|nr:ATP-binding protein [Massilia sp. CCM 9206]MDQ1922508.1 histidine kinase [Massilia sp. CCM 9206]
MTLPPSPQTDTGPDRQPDQRSADLTELLGHLTTCWDDERRLLARKLHDSLGSSMTALTMHLALLTQQLPKEKALQDRSAQMKQLLMTIINTNRDMQLSLWNDKLEFLGIKSAIAELVSDFGKEHHVVARCSLPDDDETYAREHGVALLRALEEGLRNIAAHAGATEIDVILDDGGDEIMLTVRDNGVGLGGRSGESSGCHGLRLLRERAAYLGGALSVMPAQQRGTVMTLTLPKAPVPQTAVSG